MGNKKITQSELAEIARCAEACLADHGSLVVYAGHHRPSLDCRVADEFTITKLVRKADFEPRRGKTSVGLKISGGATWLLKEHIGVEYLCHGKDDLRRLYSLLKDDYPPGTEAKLQEKMEWALGVDHPSSRPITLARDRPRGIKAGDCVIVKTDGQADQLGTVKGKHKNLSYQTVYVITLETARKGPVTIQRSKHSIELDLLRTLGNRSDE